MKNVSMTVYVYMCYSLVIFRNMFIKIHLFPAGVIQLDISVAGIL